MKVDANGSFRLSDSELNQLIQQIENGGDNFRVSLTDAFFRRPYDRTRSEGNMNNALRGFKRATDQVHIRFDARQLISDDVKHLLDQGEGTVGNVDEGGRLSGRSEMSVTFDTIRLRHGQTYRFAGILESVRTR